MFWNGDDTPECGFGAMVGFYAAYVAIFETKRSKYALCLKRSVGLLAFGRSRE